METGGEKGIYVYARIVIIDMYQPSTYFFSILAKNHTFYQSFQYHSSWANNNTQIEKKTKYIMCRKDANEKQTT